MKRKKAGMIWLLMLILVWMMPLGGKHVLADDERVIVDQIWELEVSGEEVEIKNYNGSFVNIVIPSEMQSSEMPKKTVTKIGVGAFSDNSSLEEITIPASVTSIGAGAFSNCTNLKKVTILGGY